MLTLLDALAGPVQALIFLFSHTLGGSLPGGILATGLLVRMALLPLTLRLSRRARRHARRLEGLRPALERLRERWSDDPVRLREATLELYRDHGVSPVDSGVVAGSLLQAPVYTASYRAIRGLLPALRGQGFLWIRDLSRPSPVLALAAGILVLVAGTLAPSGGSSSHAAWIRVLPALATTGFLLVTASGFALHVLASTGASAFQAGLLRWDERRRSTG